MKTPIPLIISSISLQVSLDFSQYQSYMALIIRTNINLNILDIQFCILKRDETSQTWSVIVYLKFKHSKSTFFLIEL